MGKNAWFDKHIDPDIADAVIRLIVRLPNGSTVERDFRSDLHIDYDNLEHMLEEMPSLFAFWSMVLAEHRALVALQTRAVLIRRAELVREITDSARDAGVSVRRSDLDDLIEGDVELSKKSAALIKLKRTESKLFGIQDALKMKMDSMRSLAGFKREERRNA